ncbi:CopL family metal-binding regulatory protein [Luteimonas fraxinea]|uniref:CopL family metal-binding regulatory protein n=1 Tax=Luteimonas fraxinea TaxID=2901869 RepID=A0ABS8UCV9_9GAMM|nr:CopL family metal-binding regulatory protein [Luteimonas fraxinea]MCD9096498.1 CopL family metal-binding regulatory protein [Luteimonas fraxinea]MCD9125840.1 CopL family metal-binding regulatory protein [Luteimonas fraxinea]UHH10060.1 CopL family metal-binding regulatory protein [Luteimonas fraxinea]
MRSSALVLLHLLLAVLLAFDGVGAAFAAAGPAPAMSHAAHSASETPPPCHSMASDAVEGDAHDQNSPAPDSCCDGGDCLCLHGCGSVLPVVPRVGASSGSTVVVAHVPEDRAAPHLDDPVRPPILRA